MMSGRGSRPKIASGTVTEPTDWPSRVVTFSSMSRALLSRRRGAFSGRRDGFFSSSRSSRSFISQAELARLRGLFRQRLLHRVAHRDPAALGARHCALDQNEPARHVGLHDLEVERRHAVDAEVAGHLLVLEGLARVLAAAGRAVRAVRDRHAVGGAQAAEVPALHRPGEALADRGAGHVDELADDEMIRGDLGADRNHAVLAHAELGDLALRLDLGDREMPALGLDHVLDLAGAGTELEREVAVLVLGAVGDDLTIAVAQL